MCSPKNSLEYALALTFKFVLVPLHNYTLFHYRRNIIPFCQANRYEMNMDLTEAEINPNDKNRIYEIAKQPAIFSKLKH